ncbi:preprotein translocase subunit SecY [Cupriavidus basilensis]
MTFAVVFVERGQRKILVNYAKRQVGNKVYGGQSSHLPLKLNMAGVIPPIFASSIILFPATIAGWFTSVLDERCRPVHQGPGCDAVAGTAGLHPAVRCCNYIFLLLHTALVYNSREVADNLKKSGAFIPGIRPGEQTTRYIDKILVRLTLAGAIYITTGLPVAGIPGTALERSVLFWRNLVADHRGRHDGLHGPGSVLRHVAAI